MIRLFLICACMFLFSCFGPRKDQVPEEIAHEDELVVEQDGFVVDQVEESEVLTPKNIPDKMHLKTSNKVRSIEEVMGKFDPATHDDFVVVDTRYSDQAGRIMQKEAYAAFVDMWHAAKADGVQLKIVSATRNFDYQKGIWERKWNGITKVEGHSLNQSISDPTERALKILEYSSMPGTSRHHWGTDIDLNAFENRFFEHGMGLQIYNWLMQNASNYGFCQPYTEKGVSRPEGYNEEKWHWSYIPVANDYLREVHHMTDDMIQGFDGSETAAKIGVVQKYIFGINNTCKE